MGSDTGWCGRGRHPRRASEKTGDEQVAEGKGAENPKGRGYHHGRLKHALLAAARALLAEHGSAGFTLAEAAKRVGVTGAAPYRHFADRNALMAALAQEGFENFNESLDRAWQGGAPDPVTALRRTGAAYLAFVDSEPGLYKAMFGDSRFLTEAGPRNAAETAFEALERRVVAVLRHFHAPEQNARALAMQVWALSHGAANLLLAGHFCGNLAEAESVIQTGVASLVEGAVRQSLGVERLIR